MATKDDLDNHSNQLNPNNDAYWESREAIALADARVEGQAFPTYVFVGR